jgi:sortase A
MKNNSNLKKKLPNIILALFFIVGLCIFLYPSVSDFVNELAQKKEIDQYESKISEVSDDTYEKLIFSAQEYNNSLVGNTLAQNQENLNEEEYNKLLSIESNRMIGYLKIPKIDVKLPIYHNTDQSTLSIGIGHFRGTSLPVPGETVHTVLSGHTGLPSSKLLTDLNKLEIGDNFNIIVLNQIYTYEVDQILVVEPEDTSALELVDGKQYTTLVTCTPYGINTHRLLVRGELIQDEINTDVTSEAVIVDSSITIIVITIPLIIILFIIMINIRNKKKGKEEDEFISKDKTNYF